MKRKQGSRSSHEWAVSYPAACLLLLVSVIAFVLSGCGKEEKVAPQPPIVEVVEVVKKDVPVYAEWVSTLDGMVNATI